MGVDEPLEVAEVELAAPGADEVRVRIEASGACHSDWNAVTGASATPFPAVLGHERSDIVEAVGATVTSVSPGDTVVLSWLPACGTCRACQQGRPSWTPARRDFMLSEPVGVSPDDHLLVGEPAGTRHHPG